MLGAEAAPGAAGKCSSEHLQVKESRWSSLLLNFFKTFSHALCSLLISHTILVIRHTPHNRTLGKYTCGLSAFVSLCSCSLHLQVNV